MQINLSKLPYPKFTDPDPNLILQSLISYWELNTGLTFPLNSPEYQWFQAVALQLSIAGADVNYVGRQQFLGFATGAELDNLVSNYGITRLTPVPAKTTIKYTFEQALNTDATIFAGTRIQSNDSVVIFTLDNDIKLKVGDTEGQTTATCTTSGTVGNGYVSGTIDNPLDATNITFVDNGTVANIETSTGGGATETDSALRDRAIIGLEASSTAGSRASYEYWTRSYSSNIVDAYAITLGGGVASIYFLERNGTIPSSSTISAVQAFLSGDTIRPMCDTVEVLAPEKKEYEVDFVIDYYPEYAGVIDSIIDTAKQIAEDWTSENSNFLGKDIVPCQLVSKIMALEGIYNITVTKPVLTILNPNEFAKIKTNGITITKGSPKE